MSQVPYTQAGAGRGRSPKAFLPFFSYDVRPTRLKAIFTGAAISSPTPGGGGNPPISPSAGSSGQAKQVHTEDKLFLFFLNEVILGGRGLLERRVDAGKSLGPEGRALAADVTELSQSPVLCL